MIVEQVVIHLEGSADRFPGKIRLPHHHPECSVLQPGHCFCAGHGFNIEDLVLHKTFIQAEGRKTPDAIAAHGSPGSILVVVHHFQGICADNDEAICPDSGMPVTESHCQLRPVQILDIPGVNDYKVVSTAVIFRDRQSCSVHSASPASV